MGKFDRTREQEEYEAGRTMFPEQQEASSERISVKDELLVMGLDGSLFYDPTMYQETGGVKGTISGVKIKIGPTAGIVEIAGSEVPERAAHAIISRYLRIIDKLKIEAGHVSRAKARLGGMEKLGEWTKDPKLNSYINKILGKK